MLTLLSEFSCGNRKRPVKQEPSILEAVAGGQLLTGFDLKCSLEPLVVNIDPLQVSIGLELGFDEKLSCGCKYYEVTRSR